MFSPIYSFFGGILKFFCELFNNNYGLAIIGFTLAVNIILLPLTWKQQKSTTKMQSIQPELQRIQQKYKNDKEKMNMELMKVYQENNISPMGGCLPLLIQLPIIIILYKIVYSPITYMYGPQKLAELQQQASALGLKISGGAMFEVDLAAKTNLIDFNLFNFLDLSQNPSFNNLANMLWIIPVLAGLSTYALSWLSMRQSEARKTEEQKRKEQDNPTANTMQTMNKIMPLITAFFAFSFPAAIGFYWIMNNIFKMIQQIAVNAILSKEDPLIIEPNGGNKNKKKKKK